MARPPVKKRATVEKVSDDFAIGRSYETVKPPSKKEIDRMRQRQIIRKNPRKTI